MTTKTSIREAATFMTRYEHNDPAVRQFSASTYQKYARILMAEVSNRIPGDAFRVLGKSQFDEALENLTMNRFLTVNRERFCPELDALLKRMK